MAISTVSINNTPQANGDTFYKDEGDLGVYCFDVMANDQGGSAKYLWSVDDGSAVSDLLVSDIAPGQSAADDFSAWGAKIWIQDGKIRYDASTLSAARKAQIDALGIGDSAFDTFTYTIRLGNGTLAWTTVTVVYRGVNDGVVIGTGNFSGAVTEDSADYAESGSFAFTDVDATDTHSVSSSANGSGYLGTFAATLNNDSTGDGAGQVDWTFSVDNGALQYLGVGDSLVQSYTVTVDDGEGGSATQTVTVTLHGTNDGVSIGGGVVAGAITEDSADYAESGSFAFGDIDLTDTHSVSSAADGSAYLGTFGATLNNDSTGDGSGQVDWTFNVANGAIQYLAEGETLIQTYTVTVDDGEGGSASQTVTITLTGDNDGPAISVGAGDADGATITETNSILNASDTLTVVDPDTSDTVAVEVTGVSASGDTNGLSEATLLGMLTLGASSVAADSGSANNLGWTFSSGAASAFDYLSAGESLVLTYTVVGTDDEGETDSQTVTIRIVGTNDAAVITGTASDSVIEAGGVANGTAGDATANGNLDATDVDSSADFVVQSGVAKSYGSFSIDATGLWSYTLDNGNAAVQALNLGDTLTETVTVATADGTTTTVSVTINGRNDAAVITGTASDSVIEAGGVANGTAGDATANGNLDATDVDSSADFVVQSGVAKSYGSFSIDATGLWSYTLDNGNAAVQALNLGDTLTETVTVATADGTTTTVSVTINGRNDAAVITGTASDSVIEAGGVANGTAGDATANGNLDATDVDSSADFVVQSGVAKSYGSFSIDATGLWSYTLDNGNAAVQALNLGDTLTETVTVATADGSTTTVSVTINGRNDAAVITGDAAGAVLEDSAPGTDTGNLDSTDVDNADDAWTVSSGDAAYGSYAIDAAGVWTYTLDDTNSDVDGLNAGDSLSDSFTVTTADGTSQTVTVIVNGANDAAIITGDAAGAVLEDSAPGTDTGNLDSTDVDNADDAWTVSSGDAAYGSYAIDAAGVWTYTLDDTNSDVDGLNAGDSLSDSFTVTTADGTSQTVTVIINGANDAAVIGGTASGSVAEATPSNAGTPQAQGTLTATDVDNDDNLFTASSGSSTYGSFTMTADGLWTYTLDNANTTVNNLNTGQSLADSFVVTSADGTSRTVSILIDGRTDAVAPPTGPAEFTGTGDINDNDDAGPAAGATVTVTTSQGNQFHNGTNGIDTISGGNGDDTVYGHLGDDVINGGNGGDTSLYGQQGEDRIYGGSGADEIFGGTGNDILHGYVVDAADQGGDSGDDIYGGSGHDTIFGQGGSDLIVGGFGADDLTGGGGSDTFRFIDVRDTNDTIHDFLLGSDLLDFAGVDANSTAANNQAFVWGGNTATANGLWFVQNGTTAVIYGDADGNTATAEFMVTLENVDLTPNSAAGAGGLPTGWIL